MVQIPPTFVALAAMRVSTAHLVDVSIFLTDFRTPSWMCTNYSSTLSTSCIYVFTVAMSEFSFWESCFWISNLYPNNHKWIMLTKHAINFQLLILLYEYFTTQFIFQYFYRIICTNKCLILFNRIANFFYFNFQFVLNHYIYTAFYFASV